MQSQLDSLLASQPECNDPPFEIRTTLPTVIASPEGNTTILPIIESPTVVANQPAPSSDDNQKLSVARSQLAESSADFARASARVSQRYK